jgi:hypothetical protein
MKANGRWDLIDTAFDGMTDWIHLAQDTKPVEGSCEECSVSEGFKKGRELHDQLSYY